MWDVGAGAGATTGTTAGLPPQTSVAHPLLRKGDEAAWLGGCASAKAAGLDCGRDSPLVKGSPELGNVGGAVASSCIDTGATEGGTGGAALAGPGSAGALSASSESAPDMNASASLLDWSWQLLRAAAATINHERAAKILMGCVQHACQNGTWKIPKSLRGCQQ